MNQRQRNSYILSHIRMMQGIESRNMKSVYDSIHKQFVDAANILTDRGPEALRSSLNRILIVTDVAAPIKRLYLDSGLSNAHKTYAEIQVSAKEKRKSGTMAFSDLWAQDIIKYFQMYVINQAVVPITIANKDIILSVLQQGAAEGWSYERMANELTNPLLTAWRARLVTRTESAKSAYFGRRIAEQDSGFETVKQWISAHDIRTRHAHRNVDGETVDSTARFAVPVYRGRIRVGTEMMNGPGDTSASAGNVCNCRCTDAIVAKRDSNGKLMTKPVTRASITYPGQIQRPTTITI